MGRPECSIFLCSEWGYRYRDASGGEVILCEEHARERGLSAGGASCRDLVPVRPAMEVEAEIAAKLNASPDELMLDQWMPESETPTPTTEAVMARPVRRLDTQQLFGSLKEAAEAVDGRGASLCEAMSRGAPYKGIRFAYADGNAPAKPEPAAKPAPAAPVPAPTIVKATNENGHQIRRVEPANGLPPSVTSIFAAMSSMAAGMKSLKLTDIEITTDGVSVKIGGIELSSN
jgi:hypothetical protein